MKRTQLFKKFLFPTTAILALSILVTSCGSTAEGIGSIGGNSLRYDSKERQILGQARGIGALVGAGAGYAIAKKNNKNRTAGALAGATAGGLIGNMIGTRQAERARSARLNNNQLRTLISRARANNRKLVEYNRQTKASIAKIRAADSQKRSKLARAERIRADKAIASTDSLIKRRKADVVKMAPSQRSQYVSEIRKAERERSVLVRSRNTLAGLE